MNNHPYGACPFCGSPGKTRERRPNGNDTCMQGHTYPSRNAVPVRNPAMNTPTPRTDAILEIASIEDRYLPLRDLARQLERELAARDEELARVREAGYAYRDQMREEVERTKRAEAARDAAVKALKHIAEDDLPCCTTPRDLQHIAQAAIDAAIAAKGGAMKLQERCRLAASDERMSTGALYAVAADALDAHEARIKVLEKALRPFACDCDNNSGCRAGHKIRCDNRFARAMLEEN